MGDEEIVETRKNIGIAPDAEFFVDPAATEFFQQRRSELEDNHKAWKQTFDAWRKTNPELAAIWEQALDPGMAVLANVALPEFEVGGATATRKASGATLTAVADSVPFLVGGCGSSGRPPPAIRIPGNQSVPRNVSRSAEWKRER